VTSMDLVIDETFVSRLLLGALSEHEQRVLAASLARSDPEFRASLSSILEPFEMLDGDLAREYSAALDQRPGEGERRRREILARSFAKVEDLEALLREFTVGDALALGGVTRKLFSWSMAELLLERGVKSTEDHRARTSLYLASMVIDIVEILGATGHSPYFANVIADVRQRIRRATAQRRAS
jgi:hypothetical protein